MNKNIKVNYIAKEIGRCLTEYTHPAYDELIKDAIGFVVTPLEADSHKGYPMRFEPSCGPMQALWVVLPDTDMVVKIRYVIDSSD